MILAKIQDKLVLIEFNYDCTRSSLQGQNDYAKEHVPLLLRRLYGDILCMLRKAESMLTLRELDMT